MFPRVCDKLDALDADASPPAGLSLRPVDIDQDAAGLHGLNAASSYERLGMIPRFG